ncbi:MAG: hypothetical protein ACTSRA_00010 [Promethearchaeota archaeon]
MSKYDYDLLNILRLGCINCKYLRTYSSDGYKIWIFCHCEEGKFNYDYFPCPFKEE